MGLAIHFRRSECTESTWTRCYLPSVREGRNMSESHQIQKPRSLGGFDSTGLAGIDPVHRRVCVAVPVGKFASSAYQALVNLEDLKIQVAERERAEAELRELTES